MKLLVFSDTHGDVLPMLTVIDKIKPDKIIHLGDTVKDIQEVIARLPGKDISFVSGNNDFGKGERELLFSEAGYQIFATHGHHYHVKNGLSYLLSAGRERKADIILFGHTHKALNEYQEGILLFNPGSLSYSSYKKPSYGLLQLNEGKLKSDIFVL